jgi:hypothetical protein
VVAVVVPSLVRVYYVFGPCLCFLYCIGALLLVVVVVAVVVVVLAIVGAFLLLLRSVFRAPVLYAVWSD